MVFLCNIQDFVSACLCALFGSVIKNGKDDV